MNKRIFLFSWLMMTVFTASAQVQTTSGLVSGTDQEGSMAFLGIPYVELMVFNHHCFIRNNPDRKLSEIIDRHCFKQLDEFRKTHK